MLDLRHKNLEVWKASIDFVSDIYQLTGSFPQKELYGITSQLRRAAVSVPSNLAEGCSRSSPLERKRFYEIARSSLVEMDTHFEISRRLGYCSENDLKTLSEKMNHIFALLSRLLKKTQAS